MNAETVVFGICSTILLFIMKNNLIILKKINIPLTKGSCIIRI